MIAKQFLLCAAFLGSSVLGALGQQDSATILRRGLDAAGGEVNLAAVRDITATGKVTYYWAGEEVSGSTRLRSLGLEYFRQDSSVNGKSLTLSVTGFGATALDMDATRRSLSAESALVYRSLLAPLVQLTSLDVSHNRLQPPVLTRLDETSAIRVTVVNSGQAPSALGVGTMVRNWYFDSSTYLLVRIETALRPQSSDQEMYLHRFDFSDYRTVGSLTLPFKITESLGGQALWTTRLDSYSFNTGLTRSDFYLQ